MGELNAPRELPFDFKVFEMGGIVYLFDDSCREYPCTSVAHIYIEALYWVDGECEEWLDDPGYILEASLQGVETFSVELSDEDIAPDVGDPEAWDNARTEAQTKHFT